MEFGILLYTALNGGVDAEMLRQRFGPYPQEAYEKVKGLGVVDLLDAPKVRRRGSRPLTSAQQELKELEETFATITGLALPPRTTEGQRKRSARLWWNPLREMKSVAEEETLFYIQVTVGKMREAGLTIASPLSIQNVFNSLYATRDAERTVFS